MRVQDLETPVVTIHLDMMEDNIRRVQAHLDRHGMGNRLHIKTHKVPAIGRMQLAGGASGIACQKIGEIEVFADHGVAPDVLLSLQHPRAREARPPDGSRPARRTSHGRARQRGRGARPLGGGRPPRT